MDMAVEPIEIADMRDRARQVLHEADDAEAEARRHEDEARRITGRVR